MALSKNKTTSILLSLDAQLDMGSSVYNGLQTLIEIESGEIKKTLQKVIHYADELNVDEEEALFKYKIINNIERQILANTKIPREGIKKIVDLRGMSKGFESTMLKTFGFLVLAAPIGMTIDYFLQPIFYGMYSDMIEQVKILKNIDMSKDVQLEWYLMDRPLLIYLISAYLGALFSLIGLYYYTLINYPSRIYKMIPLKAYDDIPLLLYLLNVLKSDGGSTLKVARALAAEKNFPKGMRNIYRKIEDTIDANKPMHEALLAIGFPKEIHIWIKTAEYNSSLWEKMDKIIEVSRNRSQVKLDLIKSVFSRISTIAGYAIIIYFLFGVMTSSFTVQKIASAMG